jgi:hypothetical protein
MLLANSGTAFVLRALRRTVAKLGLVLVPKVGHRQVYFRRLRLHHKITITSLERVAMFVRNSHCSWCGELFASEAWPRRCATCGNTSYLNPLPVGVALLPVAGGLLLVRRAIPPQIGQLALPGGFIEIGEDWRAAIARELFEETGIATNSLAIRFFEVLSSAGGHMLIFGICEPIERLPAFQANSETQELVVLQTPMELAFPLHTAAVARYFAGT